MDYLYINSDNMVSGTVSNGSYVINLPINKKRARLLSFQCPNTIYNITNRNNTLVFSVGGTVYNAIIPPGAYNAASLIQSLTSAMNNAASPTTFTVSQSSTTYLVTISSASVFTLRNSNPSSTLSPVLGYPTLDISGSTITATSILDLSPQTHLFIRIDQFGVKYNSTNSSYCTFVIPIDCDSGEYVRYNEGQYYIQEVNIENQNIYNLTISIRDNDNNLINLNGGSYVLVLKLE